MHALLLALTLSHGVVPLQAPADAAPPADAAATPAPAATNPAKKALDYLLGGRGKSGPSRLERLLVAGGASVVSTVGLGVGITFGIWSYYDYRCLKNIGDCNKGKSDGDKITGTKFLERRADGERKSLIADMGYLVAVTFAGVSLLALAATFWPQTWWPFYAEEPPEPPAPTQVVHDIQSFTGGSKDATDAKAPAAQPAPAPAPAPEPAAPPAPAPAPEPAPAPAPEAAPLSAPEPAPAPQPQGGTP